MHKFLQKLEDKVDELLGQEQEEHSHTNEGACDNSHPVEHTNNRYHSFSPQTSGIPKWYVDGASYFWAVSHALEEARESIYILDWWLSPELYLRRPPARNEQYRLDRMLHAAAERGVQIRIVVYKEVPQALTLNSAHTKHWLEGLHPNIKVFRHPDHTPNANDVRTELADSFQNISLGSFKLSTLPIDTLKSLYGTADDIVLYWAHHEKLLIVDNHVAFMGGLDMCFGRYDTNSHPIADVHPGDLEKIVFPGQDYNNARVYDFENVDRWENNKLDRTKNSRMGWSDISISLSGNIVGSLLIHFAERCSLMYLGRTHLRHQVFCLRVSTYLVVSIATSAATLTVTSRAKTPHRSTIIGAPVKVGMPVTAMKPIYSSLGGDATQWSSGLATEHSIANAYIDAITNAQHFVYIENQFFITATGNNQRPVENQLGAAIVNRIVRAHQNNEAFHIFVLMPAVPAFAGDLKSDGALGTRAIMEYQYNSISRGGHSIMEVARQQGVDDPSRYITFYNLRNYDRINTSETMQRAESQSGVQYEAARREFDDNAERHHDMREQNEGRYGEQYRRYQDAASKTEDRSWDTISACYMDGGPDIHSIPWHGSPESELDAFVSEELYIHSKVLIADDRLVICGSANLNDRSQLGNHDSEIAVVIEDPTPVRSRMNDQDFIASRFATSLRRQLFRKHLGLLPDQKCDRPDANWTPVTRDPNRYDWGSPADALVQDPMSPRFLELWRNTARTNTEVFSKAFHNVPNNAVRTWEEYDNFFSRHFIIPGAEAKEGDEHHDVDNSGKVNYGHVVRDEFPGGVVELKDWLSRIRGSLVEMPLDFLVDVPEMAKQGLSLNAFTDELYT
ncbi:uncharacterized protein PgNI_01688 [Pyricularia grisea]|uniref:Phospholipase n=1 Tax=Pyricularia grisea TaxID=148305 RepID=A0A6P8BHW6_PYRGI|nr:uncharacterized protein PgNI_01688 [Pyricularia grisea]TLD16204.1 hypothetical protein PgNI_01688 [Pyricularia grisea]